MLTQFEADRLIQMSKIFVDNDPIVVSPGISSARELLEATVSSSRSTYLLDIWMGTIRLSKIKYQTRTRSTIILVRLDISSSPHTNPDGQTIGGTHIHIFREGFEDKWAFNLDPYLFSNPNDKAASFTDFCSYCNVLNPPSFQVAML